MVLRLGRRGFLCAAGVALGERVAGASLSRGLTLAELVQRSEHAIVGTALDAHSDWADVAGRRMIVTDARVRVEETLARNAPAESEIVVRVLGGIVGNLGERVDGQAELVLGEPCTLFLMPVSPVLALVTGGAQGHYPLRADERGLLRLRLSPHLPLLLKKEQSGAAALSGTTLAEARDLMRRAIQ